MGENNDVKNCKIFFSQTI